MTDSLEKLFGSPARVRLMRLFLFNPGQAFTVAQAAARAQVADRAARSELAMFDSIGLVKRVRSRGRGVRVELNSDFEYTAALQGLLLNAPSAGENIYERVRRTGAIKLIITAGVFVGEWDDRLDLLIVGDKMKEPQLRAQLRKLEAELGKEVKYALLATTDFFYRLNMSDKLLRDLLDYPHAVVYDKLNIGLK